MCLLHVIIVFHRRKSAQDERTDTDHRIDNEPTQTSEIQHSPENEIENKYDTLEMNAEESKDHVYNKI